MNPVYLKEIEGKQKRERDVVREGVASGKGNHTHTHTFTLTHTKLNLRKASWPLK